MSKWKCPITECPPIHKELLVKSPDGVYHIASYRKAYNIFTCQVKSETIDRWKYFVIEELNQNKEDKKLEQNLDKSNEKLHISDVIPCYKFGTYHRDNNETEYDWFIIDTHNDKVVENLKDMELHDVRQRCREWNDNVV